ncbi:hypothetical protein RV17_GL002449 [Enterococcus thailandicus]|nr:hypothetical protein RV17_GL002449 [Enterococcus thailandicus]
MNVPDTFLRTNDVQKVNFSKNKPNNFKNRQSYFQTVFLF